MKFRRHPAPAPATSPDRNAIRAKVLIRRLRAALQTDSEASASFEEAIAGRGHGVDVLADTDFTMHGEIAVAMFLSRLPPDKFRPVLRHAWIYRPYRVGWAAEAHRQSLIAMMRYANFVIPDHLPETFTAWRGCRVPRL